MLSKIFYSELELTYFYIHNDCITRSSLSASYQCYSHFNILLKI